MSLKVLSTQVPERFPFALQLQDGLFRATDKFSFSAKCEIDGERGTLHFFVYPGCCYNGASNPIEWPIKNFYEDPKKDCCGLGHDLLYAWGGEVKGLGRALKAGEADDYIRGSMREADFSRKEAGIVDWAVRHLAHWFHWGKKHDKENMHNFSEIVWVPSR